MIALTLSFFLSFFLSFLTQSYSYRLDSFQRWDTFSTAHCNQGCRIDQGSGTPPELRPHSINGPASTTHSFRCQDYLRWQSS
ncbi:hypothetical protein ASPACDRAFT_122665 [Aspergillus aculeatus ATCC 16872]|uniref:Secreted protein n=1 Tax=Aspergillus aculeatus (strain ATCC 16872 / CBS 172.66 / WB 5094) TaxID=690307 RepID=A0A1L9WP45_ASPA1|nr:uncharacterized protein ASPACDRAFT_122665 [Aspergillus aculeatus ATCC 16872]OJJ97911.1 hypothetical protein ASPACDRAFT_122665 [Aspergillus aculeatus ATCC 16872]